MEAPNPTWIAVASGLQSFAEAAAVLFGGAWALYRFGLLREAETALEVDLEYSTIRTESTTLLVSFDVCLTNKSRIMLRAKRARRPAYSDDWENLAYGIDLLVRQIDTEALRPGSEIRWFPSENSKLPIAADIEIDLASEYVTLESDRDAASKAEITDFWLEPAESYHLRAVCGLAPGAYLALVTFLGNRNEEEFWRRSFIVDLTH